MRWFPVAGCSGGVAGGSLASGVAYPVPVSGSFGEWSHRHLLTPQSPEDLGDQADRRFTDFLPCFLKALVAIAVAVRLNEV